MDGARLFNAQVASGVPAASFAAACDSVWIDFSKGLGAPVGAALAGPRDFIEEAWRWKHQFGGAMRQAGIIAAAALYALDHHVERMAEDHENARLLADAIAGMPGLALINAPVQTNMVFFDVAGTGLSAADFKSRMLPHGLRIGDSGGTRMRAVTHLDVDRAAIDRTIVILQQVTNELASA
jgi:threonine aldolase